MDLHSFTDSNKPSQTISLAWHVDGVICRACAVFISDRIGGQTLGVFVTKPFKSWVNKSQKMNSHAM